MRPVDGENGQHGVIRRQGQELGDFARHDLGLPGGKAKRWLLLACGEILAIGFLFAPDARTHLTITLGLYAAGSLLALSAARSLSGSGPRFLLLAAALFRATLCFRAPDLSDDSARYVWDASVARQGISPYAFAPDDPAVSGVAPTRSASLPHADVRTVYPPVAQAAFRAGGMLGAGVWPLKALFAAADVSVVALILALGGPGAGFGAALYAFHPLAILESAGQGHLDALGVALLLASLVYLERRRPGRAGVAFALSLLTKYVCAFAAIPLIKRGRLRFFAAGLAVAAAIWIASIRGGVLPVGGLADYASRWEFNAAAYPALTAMFDRGDVPAAAKTAFLSLKERLGHPRWTERLFPFFYAGFFARAVLAVLLGAALIVIGWRVRRTEAAVFASLAALLLASPTLHPWYLLWVLPFAARRREPAFLYLSFSVALSYALLDPARWLPAGLIAFLEYGPFFVLLARTLVRSFASRRETSIAVERAA
ncbi:MAG: glycosyltransferase 87 family protein [Acidobacteriota bacterium]